MTTKKNYQQLRAELDELLAWFDGDDLDVDEALVKYETAMKVADQLEHYIENAENTIQKLTNKK